MNVRSKNHALWNDNRWKSNFIGLLDHWKCLKSKPLFHQRQADFHVGDKFFFRWSISAADQEWRGFRYDHDFIWINFWSFYIHWCMNNKRTTFDKVFWKIPYSIQIHIHKSFARRKWNHEKSIEHKWIKNLTNSMNLVYEIIHYEFEKIMNC